MVSYGVQGRPRLKGSIIFIGVVGLLLLSACGGLNLRRATPTPAEGLLEVNLQVTIIRFETPPPIELTPTPAPLAPTITPEPTASRIPTTSALFIPTDTPLPPPATQPPRPTAPMAVGPVSEPATATAPPPTPLPTAVAQSQNIYTGNISGLIASLDPAPAYLVAPGQDQLEFKWQWRGNELRPCQLPEGFGFDLRMWPSPTNPYLSKAQQQAVEPLGVIDAVADQAMIADSCDERSGTRRLIVTGLKDTPAVNQAGGRGQFFWDVAYVQLEPYYVPLMVSAPRDFFIQSLGSDQPTPTPSPTPLIGPTPTFQLTPGPRPVGNVDLVDPQGEPVFPANINQVEFRWRWSGPEYPACQRPEGWGFELRIGSVQPGFPRLGVFDAVTSQELLDSACDPGTGIYSYTVLDLKQAEGVQATYQGEMNWTGKFFWDVALVSINPYQSPETATPPGVFEISLSEYTGSLDPFGVLLKCDDFSAWTEAQAVFLAAGGPSKDRHDLDPDGDGYACDELRE